MKKYRPKYRSNEEKHYRAVNSKTARALVFGGLAASFTILYVGSAIKKVANVVSKPLRKRYESSDYVGRSSDLC